MRARFLVAPGLAGRPYVLFEPPEISTLKIFSADLPAEKGLMDLRGKEAKRYLYNKVIDFGKENNVAMIGLPGSALAFISRECIGLMSDLNLFNITQYDFDDSELSIARLESRAR